tara:strand:+ start:27 stop:791 length:765 start_codon:yes stop_codon:yes gene_type:complete
VINFSGRGILLDIEGTTSSIDFVYDVMFPFARRELPNYLATHWGQDHLVKVCNLLARDAQAASFQQWKSTLLANHHVETPTHLQKAVTQHVLQLMDGDAKVTGLKTLQGMIWKAGFESGEMEAHVYPDVTPELEKWKQAGVDLRIYSSGSIAAQKLFFGHSIAGNLLELFTDHYDTTIGSKRESSSYQRIAESMKMPASQILFLSDVVAELDAAATAGFQTGLCQRPENPPATVPCEHPSFVSFAEIHVSPLAR